MNTQTKTANISAMRQQQMAPREANMPSVKAGFFDLQSFELIQRVSNAFSKSDLVPNQYRNNLPNCMIAMDMAQRIGANPLMVMQNLYIVHGTPGWSSKFLVATINASGRYSSLRYEWRGTPGEQNYGCRAWALEKETGERLDGIWVDWKMVNAEGWASKNGSKWKSMPDQMFVYRAAAFWQRAYAPELGMGLQTAEELHDIIDMNPDGSVASVTTDTMRSTAREVRSEEWHQEQANPAAPTQAQAVDQETGEIKGTATADTEAQQQAGDDQGWQPTAEELAEIQAREMAEASGQQSTRRRQRSTMNGIE